jgi:hypothetical protein
MVVFILLAIAFIMAMVLFCLLLASGLRKDTIEYDLNFLWEKYPAHVRAEIRKTFE